LTRRGRNEALPCPAKTGLTSHRRHPAAGARDTGLLAKERTIAGPGFNRWLVPPLAWGVYRTLLSAAKFFQ
jgi:hypothetical protein